MFAFTTFFLNKVVEALSCNNSNVFDRVRYLFHARYILSPQLWKNINSIHSVLIQYFSIEVRTEFRGDRALMVEITIIY